ncbi:hypothetical protein ABIA22_001747 [Sinorhizobium fredii]
MTDQDFMTVLSHIGVVTLTIAAFCAWLHIKAVS